MFTHLTMFIHPIGPQTISYREEFDSDNPAKDNPKQLSKRTSAWLDKSYVHFKEWTSGETKDIGLLG
jgi:hypothetical protein